jgi:hypothetical protein
VFQTQVLVGALQRGQDHADDAAGSQHSRSS